MKTILSVLAIATHRSKFAYFISKSIISSASGTNFVTKSVVWLSLKKIVLNLLLLDTSFEIGHINLDVNQMMNDPSMSLNYLLERGQPILSGTVYIKVSSNLIICRKFPIMVGQHFVWDTPDDDHLSIDLYFCFSSSLNCK